MATRSRFLYTASAAGAFVLAPRRVRAQGEPIRVGASTNEGYGAVFYAADLGLFEKAKLPVEIVMLESGAAIAAALAGGSIDIAASSTFVFMNARRHGLPYFILASGSVYESSAPSAALVVPIPSAIKAARDLNGKVVGGLSLRSLDELSIDAWVDQNGGDSNTVKVLQVPGPSMLDLMLQGRIDAAILQEPQLSLAKSQSRVLAYNYNAIARRFLISVWFSTSDWLAKNSSHAHSFGVALQQASSWANANPEKAAVSIAKWVKVNVPRIHTINGDKLNAGLIQPICDQALKYKLIDAPLDARDFLWAGHA